MGYTLGRARLDQRALRHDAFKRVAKSQPLPVSTAQFLGLIFAVFMVCVMVGSSIYKIAAAERANVYKIPIVLHTVALLSTLATTVLYESKFIVYVCFLVFETRAVTVDGKNASASNF